jgi:hypothetical protein
MANKALGTRQKMTIRMEPAQKALKPRNSVAPAARKRAAGAHGKSASAQRQLHDRLSKKRMSAADQDE